MRVAAKRELINLKPSVFHDIQQSPALNRRTVESTGVVSTSTIFAGETKVLH